MQSKKRYKPKPERLTKADERANLEFIKSIVPGVKAPAMSLGELQPRLEREHLEWSPRGLSPLTSAEELFEAPQRAIFLVQDFSDFLNTRNPVLFDKPTKEFIEYRPRGVGLFNDLGEAGVKFLELDREAEDWARAKLSERVVKPDASIEKLKGKKRTNLGLSG